jgi:DNA-binding NarL/FixJ family response regulator
MPTRILIADDDFTIRRLLCRLIDEQPDWSVCAEASDGHDAVLKVKQLSPDVVVMDLAMPMMNGVQAAREISGIFPELPMLLLTVQEMSDQLVGEARRAGFRGAVSKSTGSEVIRAIEALLRKEPFFGGGGSPFAA